MLTGHAPILGTTTRLWPDEAACAALATTLAGQAALHNAYLELIGPLGAGKTTFVRHLLRALGVQGRIKSPTYTVMEAYALPGQTNQPSQANQKGPAGLQIAHFDFYRFHDPREWLDAGFRDVFAAPGLKLAEWPDKAQGLLPVPDLRLSLEPGDADERSVRLDAFTARGLALLG
jgi:tRNA threonylcarbamoyladenosine biosynthesis protein TsaE